RRIVRDLLLDAAVKALVLEEEAGIVVADAGLDQALRVGRRRRRDDLDARRVGEPHLDVPRMEGTGPQAPAPRAPERDRHPLPPPVPAGAGEVDDRIERAGDEVDELEFDDGPQAD